MALLLNDTPVTYYCGADTRVLIESDQAIQRWVDEAYAIEWNVSAPTLPLYGFKDKEIRGWTAGRKLVQGSLVMNLRKRNELTLAITGDAENLFYAETLGDILNPTKAQQSVDIPGLEAALTAYGLYISQHFYKVHDANSEYYINWAWQELIESGGEKRRYTAELVEEAANAYRDSDIAQQPINGSEVKVASDATFMIKYYYDADSTGAYHTKSDPVVADILQTKDDLRGELLDRGFQESKLDEFELSLVQTPQINFTMTEYDNGNPWPIITTAINEFKALYGSIKTNAEDPIAREKLKNYFWDKPEAGNYNIIPPYDLSFIDRTINLIVQIGQANLIYDDFTDFEPSDTIHIRDVKFQGEGQRINHEDRSVLMVAYPFLAKSVD